MKRIQRKRKKGWKLPENTVYVGRPTKFGNPFLVSEFGAEKAVEMYRECILNNAMVYTHIDEIMASILFDRFKWISENLSLLKGKDLVCFCKLNNPCHADVLIELCNKKT